MVCHSILSRDFRFKCSFTCLAALPRLNASQNKVPLAKSDVGVIRINVSDTEGKSLKAEEAKIWKVIASASDLLAGVPNDQIISAWSLCASRVRVAMYLLGQVVPDPSGSFVDNAKLFAVVIADHGSVHQEVSACGSSGKTVYSCSVQSSNQLLRQTTAYTRLNS